MFLLNERQQLPFELDSTSCRSAKQYQSQNSRHAVLAQKDFAEDKYSSLSIVSDPRIGSVRWHSVKLLCKPLHAPFYHLPLVARHQALTAFVSALLRVKWHCSTSHGHDVHAVVSPRPFSEHHEHESAVRRSPQSARSQESVRHRHGHRGSFAPSSSMFTVPADGYEGRVAWNTRSAILAPRLPSGKERIPECCYSQARTRLGAALIMDDGADT